MIDKDEVTGVIMRIFVAGAVAEFFGAFVMRIAQVFRNGEGAARFHIFERRADGHHG